MRNIAIAAAAALLLLSAGAAAAAGPAVESPSQLKPYNVTVRRFDASQGLAGGIDFVLPVDSPDAEHACASTLANAAAFSKKLDGDTPLPLAFTFTKVVGR